MEYTTQYAFFTTTQAENHSTWRVSTTSEPSHWTCSWVV